MTTTNQRRAHTIIETATRVVAELPAIERNLDESLAGWRADEPTTPRPARYDDPDSDTIADSSLGTEDHARSDSERLAKVLKLIDTALTEADGIRLRWARPRIDGTTVSERIAAADEHIWCASCVRHGIRNVRTHGKRCEFCAGVHADFGFDPPKALLEIHGYRKVNATDRERHMRPIIRAAKKGRK